MTIEKYIFYRILIALCFDLEPINKDIYVYEMPKE